MKSLPMASLLALVFCAGCSFFDLNEPLLELRTDRATYELREGSVITVTVENNYFKTLHYNRCMGMGLEALDGNRVAGVFGFPSCDCLCFVEFKPGERVDFTVDLGWFRQNNRSLPLVPGYRYRLYFDDFYVDREYKKRVELKSRYTNRFDLIAFTLEDDAASPPSPR